MNIRTNPDLKLRFKSLSLLDYSIHNNSLSLSLISVGESLTFFNKELDFCEELEYQKFKKIILKIDTDYPNEIIKFMEFSVFEMETISIAFSERIIEISNHNGGDGEEGWTDGVEVKYRKLIILSELNKEYKYNNYAIYKTFYDCEMVLENLNQYIKREYFYDWMQPIGIEKLNLHLKEIKLCDESNLYSLKSFLNEHVLNINSDLNKNLMKFENINEIYNLTNDLIEKIDKITAHNRSYKQFGF